MGPGLAWCPKLRTKKEQEEIDDNWWRWRWYVPSFVSSQISSFKRIFFDAERLIMSVSYLNSLTLEVSTVCTYILRTIHRRGVLYCTLTALSENWVKRHLSWRTKDRKKEEEKELRGRDLESTNQNGCFVLSEAFRCVRKVTSSHNIEWRLNVASASLSYLSSLRIRILIDTASSKISPCSPHVSFLPLALPLAQDASSTTTRTEDFYLPYTNYQLCFLFKRRIHYCGHPSWDHSGSSSIRKKSPIHVLLCRTKDKKREEIDIFLALKHARTYSRVHTRTPTYVTSNLDIHTYIHT